MSDTAWIKLRRTRNRLLKESDWTQLADTPLSDDAKQAWASYRQALRTLPDQCSDPATVEWPVKPQ